MNKIQENLSLPNKPDYPVMRSALVMAWRAMAQLVNNLFTLYYQNAQPTPPVNTMSLWVDADAVPIKYYLVANFGGTTKKVELT